MIEFPVRIAVLEIVGVAIAAVVFHVLLQKTVFAYLSVAPRKFTGRERNIITIDIVVKKC